MVDKNVFSSYQELLEDPFDDFMMRQGVGESRGVEGSRGESRGVEGSQEESEGVEGSRTIDCN